MPIITVEIETMADRGVALARLGGKPVFVEAAAPGDVAEVELVKDAGSWAAGRLVRVLSPSPHRVEPACPLFGRCGGCAWLHVAHPVQIEGKAASMWGFFSSRLKLDREVFAPPVSSPVALGYRNRLTLGVSQTKGRFFTSLTQGRSNRPIAVAHCPVANAEVNTALALLDRDKKLLALLGEATRLRLQSDREGSVRITAIGAKPPSKKLMEALAALGRTPPFAGAFYGREGSEPLAADPVWPLTEPHSTLVDGNEAPFFAPVGGFVQANPHMNRLLCAKVADLSPFYKGRKVLDLYCGSGNFTLGLASTASSVTGVEGERRAAALVKENAGASGRANVEALAAPVTAKILDRLPRADFWLLDPPRAGASEACAFAASGKGPDSIAYVSCAPATLLRDLGTLISGGYRVESVTALDMFPQTAHLEALALLTRQL